MVLLTTIVEYVANGRILEKPREDLDDSKYLQEAGELSWFDELDVLDTHTSRQLYHVDGMYR